MEAIRRFVTVIIGTARIVGLCGAGSIGTVSVLLSVPA